MYASNNASNFIIQGRPSNILATIRPTEHITNYKDRAFYLI